MLMCLPETVEIPGKNIALEITKQNQKLLGSIGPFHMMFVIIYVSIPFILALLNERPTFVNEYERNIYLCHLFPNFMIGMLNFGIYNLANQLMHNKMMYA